MEFYHAVPVMCEVHRRLPRQRTSVNRVSVQRHLDALVLDIARILVTVGVRLARKGRKLEELVVRIGLVVGQVDAQPVVEEPPFEPRLEGVGHLRLEVGAGGGVGGIDAPSGRDVRLRLVMNMGMSFPTRLHVRRTLANEIHRGSSNILPITHDAPAE